MGYLFSFLNFDHRLKSETETWSDNFGLRMAGGEELEDEDEKTWDTIGHRISPNCELL